LTPEEPQASEESVRAKFLLGVRGTRPDRRTSENAVKAKFAELPCHALGVNELPAGLAFVPGC
jgi:hypothetical protein